MKYGRQRNLKLQMEAGGRAQRVTIFPVIETGNYEAELCITIMGNAHYMVSEAKSLKKAIHELRFMYLVEKRKAESFKSGTYLFN